jgi:hypothetical protein
LICAASWSIAAQTRFSIATDIGVLTSWKNNQRFFAYCNKLQTSFHLSPRDGAYASFTYASPGKFRNHLYADAKDPSVTPQAIPFTNRVSLRIKEFSAGWKHYLVGSATDGTHWGLYHVIGFGLLLGKAENRYATNTVIDTSLYRYPENPVSGTGRFKRLTLDLAFGWEAPLGADIFFYNEARAAIPTSDYPSKYLLTNKHAPLNIVVATGIRIMF